MWRHGLSPLWGFCVLPLFTHALRRGLYSCAAPQLPFLLIHAQNVRSNVRY